MTEILVIDDDEFILSTMQEILVDAGFRVTTTADGPQGIELYARVKPAAVVLDLGLPSMDGLQVLRRIIELDADARVLVVTGYPSDAAEQAARRMGARTFVPKPFDAKTLVERLTGILRQPG